MKRFVLLIILGLGVFSCKTANENKIKIIGKWNTVNWIIDDSNIQRNNKMDFSFFENDRYEVDYGSEKELGKYWFEGNDLYTIEDQHAMKKVSVIFNGQDTMVMKMNRAGQKETVTLYRVN